ncbi:hypothetical protein [Ornithinibacillus gellani]|uniref:hypothetical protein n=1 Tax=Ornithinibacillus gellani TaxID=2293253 RepID=UPI00295853E2|nr:hypothetical protein [Ornithinibacillus gellani]
MTAVGGLLGAFTQPIVGSLISNMGWRNAYYSIGIAVIIIVVPTILLLLRQSPKDKGLQPYGVDMVDEDKEKENKPQGIDFDIAKKSKAFLCLAISSSSLQPFPVLPFIFRPIWLTMDTRLPL